VVGISALGRGVAHNAGFVTASLEMDDLVAGAGVKYRALTMPSFMDNLLRQADPIKNRGVFFSPIDGDRKMPSCATADIADAASMPHRAMDIPENPSRKHCVDEQRPVVATDRVPQRHPHPEPAGHQGPSPGTEHRGQRADGKCCGQRGAVDHP
jgi:hypothetical protein